ncbi:uncharacterized protein LOC111702628 [Eurytemora carolleeae]|uniref:uncharacterized protein LOC111702628 n=1 Tax=Eurytemora carolleeae TaxID=1294199 RepID=UPI000C78077A|nr:uncharacterized protein LOC111702628 [Eurytemora carolleeae]|eukprot:XP_023330149.1 uncharacterized protein LOC111702628 [Eurytemora affinis]
MSSSSEDLVNSLFSLYDKWGTQNYIGEKVSQLQHAQQVARLAEDAGSSEDIVLAGFLHDIGHIIGLEEGLKNMEQDGVTLGTAEHEEVGENYLRKLGFPEKVTQFVKAHVQAKRYLVFKNPEYYNTLSDASKGTLICQGGPMSVSEAEVFENLESFQDILNMRSWDEKAKNPNIQIISNEKYRQIAIRTINE